MTQPGAINHAEIIQIAKKIHYILTAGNTRLIFHTNSFLQTMHYKYSQEYIQNPIPTAELSSSQCNFLNELLCQLQLVTQ